ncbi:amino acid ABC transporter substrate-binding protein [Pseudomonas agarici]|uniref:Amino acid ABC transporter substrate-binding protein n=1 Tax=Pseudomonas agarici TaxID=46677 RepID=A0A0X1T4B5_PSEAA|nr:transporter substrate-binding domain-containing protein [Pseudomonas agarici]AMB86880.1 amino acid ABC transporter substrate-binding protein [Pseudomonas agarici]NWB90505.1 transporter substrate-binding domain-containing protein [Pseudomonas agarici]
MEQGKRLTRLLGAACLSVAMVSVSPCASAWDKQRGTLRFGVEALVPPFESRDAQGQLVGLNIELGEALCAELKTRCEWIDQDYAGMIPALQDKRFDAIMPMTSTAERRQLIDFTDPMYPLQSRLVSRKGDGLGPTAERLAGKRVGVLAGTVREGFANAEWAPKGVQVRRYALNSELIAALLAGEIDATLQDSIEISEALLKTPQGDGFDFAGPPIVDPRLGNGVSMGVRQADSELRDTLNRALKSLKASGRHQAIVARYLPSAAPVAAEPMQFIAAAPGMPFSRAVRVGEMLYLSGVLGSDSSGKLVPGGIRGEMQQAMQLIAQELERNGSALEQVAKCTVILADIKDFAAMNEVYVRHFPADRLPSRTTFQAGGLLDKARVEVECLAYVGP